MPYNKHNTTLNFKNLHGACMPKVGIKFLLISQNLLCLLVPGSQALFPYFCYCIVNPFDPYSPLNFIILVFWSKASYNNNDIISYVAIQLSFTINHACFIGMAYCQGHQLIKLIKAFQMSIHIKRLNRPCSKLNATGDTCGSSAPP